MNETINVTLAYRGETESVPVENDTVLQDFIDQCAKQGILNLPAGENWNVKKEKNNTALDLSKTLADNGVVDGDVLCMAMLVKGGAK